MTYYTETPKTTNQVNHLYKLAHKFEKFITEQGYSAPTICQYRTSADALCVSLTSSGNSIWELTDELSNKLITRLVSKASHGDRKHIKYRLERFRDYLIEYANAPSRATSPVDMSSRACLRREYVAYLKEQRGLSISTIKHCLRFHDLFFTYMFGANHGNLNDIGPDNVTSFILERRGGAPRDKTIPSHLRNLFKFLFWNGRTKRDLSKTIPRTKQPKPTQIPRYLPPDEVEQLLNAARNNALTGRPPSMVNLKPYSAFIFQLIHI